MFAWALEWSSSGSRRRRRAPAPGTRGGGSDGDGVLQRDAERRRGQGRGQRSERGERRDERVSASPPREREGDISSIIIVSRASPSSNANAPALNRYWVSVPAVFLRGAAWRTPPYPAPTLYREVVGEREREVQVIICIHEAYPPALRQLSTDAAGALRPLLRRSNRMAPA